MTVTTNRCLALIGKTEPGLQTSHFQKTLHVTHFRHFVRICITFKKPAKKIPRKIQGLACSKVGTIFAYSFRVKNVKNSSAVFWILLLFQHSLFSFEGAAPENPTGDCPTLLAQAEKYYFQLEYSKVLQTLERLRQICPSESQGWVVAARVHGAQGKRKEALADFQELLAVNPAYELDAAQYPPSLQKIFKEAKEIFEQQRIAALQQPAQSQPSAVAPVPEPKQRRRKIPKGLILGGLGALGAGILAAVLTTQGGGGGETPAAQVSSNAAGSVAIEFK